MSLGDTSNESSQRDKSLPHNNSPEEKCSLTDDVKYSDEAEIITKAKLSDQQVHTHNSVNNSNASPFESLKPKYRQDRVETSSHFPIIRK